MHYVPPIMTALREEVCDGFVIGGGASRVIDNGTIAATANKPFWLQLVGTSAATSWAVLTARRDQLQQRTTRRWSAGYRVCAALSVDGPGMGVELNEDAVERYRIEPLKQPRQNPTDVLYAIRFPSGATIYYVSATLYRAEFLEGKMPVFAKGVYLEQVDNNGSAEWRDIHARAMKEGSVHSGGRPL
jgi:hypothetical protein